MKCQGILLIDKPKGSTSFSLVASLRRRLGVKKIGHSGTLDPFATGVMVLLVGRDYTRLSNEFLAADKEYEGKIHLGITTDSFDCEGKETGCSQFVPSREELFCAIAKFQGDILQVPPMFSAKKIQGKKLYELARKGIEVPRTPVSVNVSIELLDYRYPYVDIRVVCSKGTYIRSLANDIGSALGCGGHLVALRRTRNGSFRLEECFDGALILDPSFDISARLRHDSIRGNEG